MATTHEERVRIQRLLELDKERENAAGLIASSKRLRALLSRLERDLVSLSQADCTLDLELKRTLDRYGQLNQHILEIGPLVEALE